MSEPCQAERDAVGRISGEIREAEESLTDAPHDLIPKIKEAIGQLKGRKAFLVKQLDVCVAAHTPPPPIRCVAVKLVSIVCESNGFGGSASLHGRIFGATFEKQTGLQVSTNDIFPFPSGPLTISEGQTLPIRMDESVKFCGPGTQFLRLGGELNLNLGSKFVDVDLLDVSPVGAPQMRPVELKTANFAVVLRFSLEPAP